MVHRILSLCCLQALVTVEVAEAVGGFTALTPSGTSVLLEGQLAKAPENAKQVPDQPPLLQSPFPSS